MIAQLTKRLEMGPTHPDYVPGKWLEVGALVENPDAYMLVRLGVAVPFDDECKLAANMTNGQMDAAQAAHRRVSLGIHPDDYAAFDAGQMLGYDEDGSWIPGPNAIEEDDDE